MLVAIGRKANTAGLDLAAGKIDNDKGRILVNDKMETNVPGVYAIGDCVFGHAQLAHTASAMGEVACGEHLRPGGPLLTKRPTPPACTWSRRRPPWV